MIETKMTVYEIPRYFRINFIIIFYYKDLESHFKYALIVSDTVAV